MDTENKDNEITHKARILLQKAQDIKTDFHLPIGPSLLNMADEIDWAKKLMSLSSPSTPDGVKLRLKAVLNEVIRCGISLYYCELEHPNEDVTNIKDLRCELFNFIKQNLEERPDLFPNSHLLEVEWSEFNDGYGCSHSNLMFEILPFRGKWITRLAGVFVGMGITVEEAKLCAFSQSHNLFGISKS